MDEPKANEKLKQKIKEEFGDSEKVNKRIKEEEQKVESDKVKIKFGECYERIIQILKRYIDLKEEYYPIISMWIIGTYLHSEFETYPYLFLNAMRGSGKTRLLKLISILSAGSKGKVKVHTGVTESVLFRTPKNITLILDELEHIGGKDKGILREYLNASYKKGGTVSRTRKVKSKTGEDYVIDEFEPYKPIAMANIWGMEEVLGDRCITIILERSNNPAKVKMIENYEKDEDILTTLTTLNNIQCSLCSVVTLNNIYKRWNYYINHKYNIYNNNYTTTYTTLITPNNTNYTNNSSLLKKQQDFEFFNKIDNSGIDGRNLELTMPFFIISKFLNDELFDEIIKTYKKIINEKKIEEFTESRDVMLYDFISQEPDGKYYISIKKLTTKFREFIQSNEDWINDKWMGRALKRLGLTRDKKRMGHGVEVILNIDKAQEKIKMFK